jgi:hypothetical protein
VLSYRAIVIQTNFRKDPLVQSAFLRCLVLFLCVGSSGNAVAQRPTVSQELGGLPSIGSPSDERQRIEQLLGRAATDGYLLRSTSRLFSAPPPDSAPTLRLQLLLPELRTVWNSDLPYSLNDGALWAGRGVSTLLTGGVRARVGIVSLVLAPEVRYEQNREFRLVLYPLADRSPYSARWHWPTLPISIDLPTRFGDESRAFLGPGQSSLTVDAGPLAVGWATDDQWWGPGIRNAIVMSNNAPGIPRLFVGSGRPLSSPIGDFEFQWNAGRLKESIYFDSIPSNDLRHLSGFVLTYRPAGEPGLTLGASRTVIGRLSGMDDFPDRMFSAFLAKERKEEQIASLFARWVFPAAGFEAYGEWARHRLTSSLREFLITPNHTQGYTAGLQWVRPVTSDSSGMLRLQSELTYLEQSATTRHRPTGSFYTSDTLPQGYTQRGQVIGAAIGPGASSQWIAGDYLARDWQLGLFLGRIRWDNDAYYLTQEPYPLDHDVSVLGGLRGGGRLPGMWVDLELTSAKRYNFMFQNEAKVFGQASTWDVINHTLRLTVTPAVARPRTGLAPASARTRGAVPPLPAP